MTGADLTEGRPAKLRQGVLGVAAITFFVVSAAGPLVAMAGGAPVAMLLGDGSGLPAAFVATAVLLLLFAVGYTTMSRYVRNAGGFYALTARGLGGRCAGAAAFVALASYAAMQLGLYGLFGAATSELLRHHANLALPWWAYSFAALLTIAGLGYGQVDLSVRVLSGLVACEYLVVLVLDCAILVHGGAHGLSAGPFGPRQALQGSPPVALLLCFSAFVGFEATTLYSEEAKDPRRTIPRATYLSICLIGAMYALSSWCVVEGVGERGLMVRLQALPDPTTLLFALSDTYVGPALTLTMRLLFVTSAYASLLSFHNATSRYLFVLGREGLAPSSLGRVHPVRRSPHCASLTQSIVSAIILAVAVIARADPVLTLFSIASGLGSLGVIVLMGLSSSASYRFISSTVDPTPPRYAAAAAAASAVALVVVAAVGCARFDALSGHSSIVAHAIPMLLLVAAVLGLLMAERLRRCAPGRFVLLGCDTD